MKKNKILLVQPNFPKVNKSKNHSDFLPIGLLKLATYYKKRGHDVRKLLYGEQAAGFNPDKILITSLFTYWSKYVRKSVKYYKKRYPEAKIIVGGIYASLMPGHCKEYTGCDEVFFGIHKSAEKCKPDYSLVDIDYQILHSTRGCVRSCNFCGTWKIEPEFTFKKSIKKEIIKNKVIFYDNNLLANPHIQNILREVRETKINNKSIIAECQSGLDGRLLTLDLAKQLKASRFQNPRIAWDGKYKLYPRIERQLKLLIEAGYKAKEIYIFVLYNFDIQFEEMELKRLKCREWSVQIADCRYRPLNHTFDNYNSRIIGQTNNDYYIHEKWTDEQIKKFRRNIREQNICIRHGFNEYNHSLELLGRKKNSQKITV